MNTLRLRQFAEGENRYRVLAELESNGARRTAETSFDFHLSAQDQEDLRWYLEDYLVYPLDPAPTIAKRIEGRMVEIGVELFRDVLGNTPIWGEARHHLSDTRIEISTTVKDATAIPWELLRDPDAAVPLALRARAFVRTTNNSVQQPELPQSAGESIRVLLVICRPKGSGDVPFRSVAKRLVEGLRESAAVRLTVLRPPTFERLAAVLRDAKAKSDPYHLVHFDGHGVWSGHGYLLFENAALDDNRQLIDGPALGSLLAETGVSLLVLNACQSAYADAPSKPMAVALENVHEETRAFGSLAQEVMDAGTAGVVAMRYSVFVDTAAHFMADLYARLIKGDALGEAVTFGRKQLHAATRPIQDWVVPVVFEAASVELFPRRAETAKLSIKLGKAGAGEMEGLPSRPDAGFFGRDETLLALDRAFDKHPIVLLHAYAGSGKTATAAEFARWYRETGGIDGPILFTSFEQYKPLSSVLNQMGQVFERALEQAGINWLALDDAAHREISLQVLQQIPVLWIWDNVEPVAGFPTGTESKWSAAEQRELANFLRAARDTNAKFLLTSRREERDWLHDLPVRVVVPPMPFQERLMFARALAEKQGRRLTDVEDWRPLLEFTQGNPLAITVLVAQALRDGLRSRKQIDAFVARLRSGEAAFEDEAEEGRTRSLAASLNYGFEHAFSEAERKQLALLHLFQGFVDVDALRAMGRPEAEWCLPEVSGLTREVGIALLDRASEVGLLAAHGSGYYSIHPALPWFFRNLFEEHYNDVRERALRANVGALGALGNYYFGQYQIGNREVIGALKAEEPNLLNALTLARKHGWWEDVVQTMQGLDELYDYTGRRAEWARLVEEIVPDFVDPATEGPLPDRDAGWRSVAEYRVRLARGARRWAEAEHLQQINLEWDRRRVRDTDQNSIRTVSVGLQQLGDIQRETGRPECVEVYQESFDLMMRIADSSAAAVIAFNMGHAYKDLSSLRDLDEAEGWYRKSLDLRAEGDRMGRLNCLGQLGNLAAERFKDARRAKKAEPQLLRYLNDALRYYHEALELTPSDAVAPLAVVHNQLGLRYMDAGDVDRALHHYRESIRFEELQSNHYGAAQTQYNVADALMNADRFADAREYALAALRNFQTYGAGAQQNVEDTLGLIAHIDKAAAGG